jgi:hypothetical protein
MFGSSQQIKTPTIDLRGPSDDRRWRPFEQIDGVARVA